MTLATRDRGGRTTYLLRGLPQSRQQRCPERVPGAFLPLTLQGTSHTAADRCEDNVRRQLVWYIAAFMGFALLWAAAVSTYRRANEDAALATLSAAALSASDTLDAYLLRASNHVLTVARIPTLQDEAARASDTP